MSNQAVSLSLRKSTERGNNDHGWLHTFLSFSFADYSDRKHDSFGVLRVLNEDRVEPHEGFGTHAHREFEIFSYVVSGELKHKDSMGNTEIIKKGDVQMTSAGTGIRHSEHSNGNEQVHFLQMWAFPSTSGLKPAYYTRHFTDDEKRDTLVRIVAPLGSEGVVDKREVSGPAPIHSPLTVFASLLSPSKTLTHTMGTGKLYIHNIQKSGYNTGPATGSHLKINGSSELREGDAVYGTGKAGETITIENVGSTPAEFLVFDVGDA